MRCASYEVFLWRVCGTNKLALLDPFIFLGTFLSKLVLMVWMGRVMNVLIFSLRVAGFISEDAGRGLFSLIILFRSRKLAIFEQLFTIVCSLANLMRIDEF